MSIQNDLETRAGSKCELCTTDNNLQIFALPPASDGNADQCIYACSTCCEQITDPDKIDIHHWRCLTQSMWSQIPAVQVMAWRMLNALKNEAWAQDALDMLYLDEESLIWAKSGMPKNDEDTLKHQDANGAQLTAGDTVTLIKDLQVKGAGFTAKRGTAVRNISLVADNEKHIEGRVNGQQIVILTEFVKKS